MAGLPTSARVASIIVPGEDADPAQGLRDGSYRINWGGSTVSQFKEVKVPHVTDENLALPTLYLHFLDKEFRVEQGTLIHALRSGNDASEVIMKLPSSYFSHGFAEQCDHLADKVNIVVEAIRSQGEVMITGSASDSADVEAGTLFFSLKTARPKAGVSLDKKAFGIPMDADQYLFVNNHSSILYFDDRVKEAFNECISGLADMEGYPPAKKFGVFLKIFYEGGFGYNKKVTVGATGYLPVNVGTAAMSVVPAFDGQVGIGTGYPYKLPAPFLPFTETVPISIEGIRSMSEFHGRYGLAFTRLIFVWEGDLWEDFRTLSFCSILPHGGFFYVPDTLSAHAAKGGLVYSFGESTSDSPELSIA